jgi:hypothetical protein
MWVSVESTWGYKEIEKLKNKETTTLDMLTRSSGRTSEVSDTGSGPTTIVFARAMLAAGHPIVNSLQHLDPAYATLSENNAPPAVASKWLLSNGTNPW